MRDIYSKIAFAQKENKTIALCTVVNTKGSTPRKVGAKMIVYENKTIYGTIGGGELEKCVIENAVASIKENKPKLYRHDLLHQHSMCCGGTVDIYIEPICKKNKLYIFGAGHTGQALAKYAVDFNFETVLIDNRKEYINQCVLEEVNKMNLSYSQALSVLPFDENTFVCIMTHSHAMDREILAFCLTKPTAYLGMIGSARKVEMTKKLFREALNVPEERIEEIDMPIGIDIGAETPEEIAMSIVSKLIATKNKAKQWKKELQL